MSEPGKVDTNLRYCAAAEVHAGDQTLDGFEVRNLIGAKLGELAGVLIDQASNRVRFLVVGLASRLGILPMDGAQLDGDHRAVIVFQS